MNNYDSILKEKKTIIEDNSPVKKHKYTKYIIIDLILVLLILIVSYVVYCQVILTGKNIFLHDMNVFSKIISPVFDGLNLEFMKEDYQVSGDFSIDQHHYHYQMLRNNAILNVFLKDEIHDFSYYVNDNVSYTKVDDILNQKFIEKVGDNHLNILYKIYHNFSDVIDDDDFIRRVYLDNGIPVVEVNLVLNQEMISRIINGSLGNDDMEFIFTLRNHAVTDEVISGKLVIHNKTTRERFVLTYEDGDFIFVNDSGVKFRFHIEKSRSDVSLKISKNDVLYSVLSGTKKENSYQYSYQVIDRIYNVSLNVFNNESSMSYEFHSNIKRNNLDVVNDLKVVTNVLDGVVLNQTINNKKKYTDLSLEEKKLLDEQVKDIFLPIRKFIDEYKDCIN